MINAAADDETAAPAEPADTGPFDHPLDDTELIDYIEYLTGLCQSPPDDLDLTQTRGELGMAWLEWYDRHQDPASLANGLEHLRLAVEADPNHPDRFAWFYWLGVGHQRLAQYGEPARHYDEAVGWLARLVDQMPPGEDRDAAVVELADVSMSRFLQLAQPDDPSTGVEIDLLVARLEGLRVDRPGVEHHLLRCIVGLARFERYLRHEQPADLDLAIERLAGSVSQLPDDTPRLGLCLYALAEAYWIRASTDEDDREAIDRCVDVARQALAHCDRIGGPNRPSLAGLVACGHHARWDTDRDRNDLDEALRHWQLVWSHEPDSFAGIAYASLLIARAELDGCRSDVDEAIALLTGLVGAVDQESEFEARTRLAEAYEVAATLGADHTALARSAAELARAAPLASDPSDQLTAHTRRLNVTWSLVQHGDAPLATLQDLVEEGTELLSRAADADPSARSRLALMLVRHRLNVGLKLLRMPDLADLKHLLRIADEWSSAPLFWQRAVAMYRGLLDQAEAYEHHQDRVTDAAEQMIPLLNSPELNEFHDDVRTSVGRLAFMRAVRLGDVGAIQAAADLVNSGREASDDPEDRVDAGLIGAMSALASGDQAGAAARATELARDLAAVASTPYTDVVLRPLVQVLLRLLGQPDHSSDPAPASWTGPPSQLTVFGQVMQLLNRLTAAQREDPVTTIRSCASEIEQLWPTTESMPLARAMLSALAGMVYAMLLRLDPDDQTLRDRATFFYEKAIEHLDSEDSPLWIHMALDFSEVLRHRGGDRPRSRRLGLSALRSLARQVMLQDRVDDALAVARPATGHANRVAAWCIADGALDAAVEALDQGRGLVLQAVMTSRDIADRLAALGHADLAAEWRATAGHGRDGFTGAPLSAVDGDVVVPDALRARVLRALSGSRTDLTEPVAPAQLRLALNDGGADALAYLVPAADDRPGYALVVTAQGTVERLVLPDLRVDEQTPIRPFAHATARGRDLAPAPSPGSGGRLDGRNELDRRLDELGRWAWSAAIGPLIDHSGAWSPGRRPRVILVPMGELALVPWHAAYVPTAHGPRYALADLVLSYSPSARLYGNAVRSPVEPIQAALIVGNPTHDLDFAGREARAIHQAFYPDGVYLGPGPTSAGPGTRDEVLRWIASTAGRPALLHLACHGTVDPDHPADAQLHLAGGPLRARDLIEAVRVAELVIDYVFLAACTTNTTGGNYDEAFSLASAFLAAGARTVYGSLWTVPDSETSLLMFMVHHYLVRERLGPAEALHAAQLWMLDPARVAPASMPADLAALTGSASLARPTAWAAFTHLGR